MKVIGITGGYATGKSTVAGIFKELGSGVITADKIAKEVVRPGSAGWKQIVDYFGKHVLCKNKRINRKKLSNIVFSNQEARRKLNKILHPLIINDIKKKIDFLKRNRKQDIAIIDAALLFEAHIEYIFDYIIVVKCSSVRQMKRAVLRDNLNIEDVSRRTKSQLALNRKIKQADYVIDNNGTITETKKKVGVIWKKIKSREHVVM